MSEKEKKVLASPKARKFARELGVNITQIEGSERQGRVIESDIKHFVSSHINVTPKSENRNDQIW